jgi:hypothetical protein
MRLYEQSQKDRKTELTKTQRSLMRTERRRLTEAFGVKKTAMKDRLTAQESMPLAGIDVSMSMLDRTLDDSRQHMDKLATPNPRSKSGAP